MTMEGDVIPCQHVDRSGIKKSQNVLHSRKSEIILTYPGFVLLFFFFFIPIFIFVFFFFYVFLLFVTAWYLVLVT